MPPSKSSKAIKIEQTIRNCWNDISRIRHTWMLPFYLFSNTDLRDRIRREWCAMRMMANIITTYHLTLWLKHLIILKVYTQEYHQHSAFHIADCQMDMFSAILHAHQENRLHENNLFINNVNGLLRKKSLLFHR